MSAVTADRIASCSRQSKMPRKLSFCIFQLTVSFDNAAGSVFLVKDDTMNMTAMPAI